VAGRAPHARVTLASLRDGHIIRQLDLEITELRSLAASPTGDTLYYADGNTIWSVPLDGSAKPRPIGQGTFITADPSGNYLYVADVASDPIRLRRLPLHGGVPTQVVIPEHLRVSAQDFGPAAFDRHGRLLIATSPRDTWFYRVGILDDKGGTFTPIPLRFGWGIGSPNWTADGQVLALGVGLGSSLWHYRLTS